MKKLIFPEGYLSNLLNKALHDFNKNVGYQIKRDDIIIYLPLLLSQIMLDEFRIVYGAGEIDRSTGLMKSFRGIKVVPGYENKIVIAYVNSIQTNEPEKYILKCDIVSQPEEKTEFIDLSQLDN
jgi:hypothetical protein